MAGTKSSVVLRAAQPTTDLSAQDDYERPSVLSADDCEAKAREKCIRWPILSYHRSDQFPRNDPPATYRIRRSGVPAFQRLPGGRLD